MSDAGWRWARAATGSRYECEEGRHELTSTSLMELSGGAGPSLPEPPHKATVYIAL